MRIKFKPLALCFGIVAGLASCSSDDDNSGVNPIVDEGTPTSIKLSITQPKTYATVDPNATDAEAALKTVDVFIYNTANTLVRHAALTDNDFNQNGANGNNDLYESKTSINTTTGSKTVYVGVNLPAGIVANIREAGTVAGLEAVNSISVSDIASVSSGFSMFSTDPKTSIFVEDETDPANNITVTVARLAAKLTVHAAADLNTTASGGTISDVSFSTANSNKKIYAYQKIEGGIIKDPNWGTYIASDFESFTAAGDYVAINPAGETNVKNYRAKYFPENTTENYLQKETSYASIRVKFAPNIFIDGDGNEKVTSGNVDGTFWTVRLTNGTVQYFDDETEADTYNAANLGSKKSEYKEGYAYYNMYVNRDEKYDVIRNQYYKATVTDILGLGNPDPGPTEPEIPVETPTKIKVNIEIVAWTLVEEDFQLIP